MRICRTLSVITPPSASTDDLTHRDTSVNQPSAFQGVRAYRGSLLISIQRRSQDVACAGASGISSAAVNGIQHVCAELTLSAFKASAKYTEFWNSAESSTKH